MFDPIQDTVLMDLPIQDIEVSGFGLHENSIFSTSFSSYLRYLDTHHILLRDDAVEVTEIEFDDEFDDLESASDDSFLQYNVKTISIVESTTLTLYNDDSIAFTFVDELLYSASCVKVVEIC